MAQPKAWLKVAGAISGILIITAILAIMEAFRGDDTYKKKVCGILRKERTKVLRGKE